MYGHVALYAIASVNPRGDMFVEVCDERLSLTTRVSRSIGMAEILTISDSLQQSSSARRQDARTFISNNFSSSFRCRRNGWTVQS